MNMTARQLKAFVTAARLGSFTRAAEEIAVTQSGFSLMLKELEAQIGARLFDRTTRSVRITAAGARLLPVAQRTLAELESVVGSITRMSEQANRVVTIAATPLIAASILPEVCRDFVNAYPHVRLHVKDTNRKEILELVESGGTDLGLGAFFKPAAGIERRRIARFHLAYLSGGASHNWESGDFAASDALPWERIPDEPLIALPPENPIQQIIDGCLKDIGRSIEQRDVCNNLLTAIAWVEAEYGAAILPSFVSPMCERYRVKVHKLGAPVAPVDFFMVTKKGRQLPDVADLFVKELAQRMIDL